MALIETQFLYIMVMEDDPSRIKIGFSTNPIRRCKELYSTSVPSPLHILHTWQVSNMRQAEKLIHNELNIYRCNPRREFFHLDLIAYCKYSDIDYCNDNTINCLMIANRLAKDIEQILQENSIEFHPTNLGKLEAYDRHICKSKNKNIT